MLIDLPLDITISENSFREVLVFFITIIIMTF